MLAVLVEMNFFVFSFRFPVNNHAANSAPEAKPIPIANVLVLLILLINLIFCVFVAVLSKKTFDDVIFQTQNNTSLGHHFSKEEINYLGYGAPSSRIEKHQQSRTDIKRALWEQVRFA